MGKYMRDKINRLASGIVETDIPKLKITPESIDTQVLYGEITKFEIELSSENNVYIKGLAYSSNIRVKILTPAFGGYNVSIFAEVDSRYRTADETIKGEINLITGGGERSIPFIFRVFAGQTGKTLNSLRTIEDFTAIAKEDPQTALRIFEYKDFTQALFMSDMKLRAFYTGFIARPDKQTAMEEFLVSSKAKKPIRISFEQESYIYENLRERQSFSIPIRKNTWGHFKLSVKTGAEFIYLHHKNISEDDFEGNTCVFQFDIIPKKLSQGKNAARIEFYCANASYELKIEVHNKAEKSTERRNSNYRRHFFAYLRYRLLYECRKDDALPEKMIEELDRIAEEGEKRLLIKLLKAEALFLKGDEYLTRAILDEEREALRFHRHERYFEYILFEYISLIADEVAGQRDYFIKQVKKLIEQGYYEFAPFLIKADRVLNESPALLFEFLSEAYRAGVRSPFIYLHYCRILNENPEFLHGIFDMETAALHFGIDEDLLSDALMEEIAIRARNMRSLKTSHSLLFKKIYQKNLDKEILSALCSLLVDTDCRNQSVHIWYELGMEEDVAVDGIFEYYIYTFPESEKKLIHEKVIAYFLVNQSLDHVSKTLLYKNILEYADKEGDIYKDFYPQIRSFAQEQLLSLRINKHLAVIYRSILREDMIDKRLAKVIPTVLSAYEIEYDSKHIKAAVVIYPELNGDYIYNLDESTAYVPVFSAHASILLQDGFGNRYNSLNAKKELLLDMPEILEACKRLCPNHQLFELERILSLLKGGEISFEDAKLMKDATRDMNLSDMFRSRIMSKIIEFFKENSKKPSGPDIWVLEDNYDFLVEADKESLSAKDRGMICDTLINIGYLKEAYEMVLKYGHDIVSPDHLLKLCSRLISAKQFEQGRLGRVSFEVLRSGYSDQILLEYLCKKYNGSTENMFMLLNASVSEHVETYDLEERLIAQMLFSGNTQYLDQSFAWYVSRKKTNELIVRAYFTLKSEEFFMQDKELPQRVFEYLENAITNASETARIPTIYKLAATKYYADMSDIEEEKKTLLGAMINDLIDKGFIFPYYKKLSKWIALPQDIKDKEMVVYYGNKFSLPRLRSRILPYENEFKPDDMRRIYMNIFIKEKLLFGGDIWEYEIYEEDEEGRESIRASGSLKHGIESSLNAQSRFENLNRLDILSVDKSQGLQEKLEDYIVKNEIAAKFFDLL
ncbi:MAG: DUF5717 family protein [Johnsonella sp.]|nr:DUF5717 family protein [Johnsonella sp.]